MYTILLCLLSVILNRSNLKVQAQLERIVGEIKDEFHIFEFHRMRHPRSSNEEKPAWVDQAMKVLNEYAKDNGFQAQAWPDDMFHVLSTAEGEGRTVLVNIAGLTHISQQFPELKRELSGWTKDHLHENVENLAKEFALELDKDIRIVPITIMFDSKTPAKSKREPPLITGLVVENQPSELGLIIACMLHCPKQTQKYEL